MPVPSGSAALRAAPSEITRFAPPPPPAPPVQVSTSIAPSVADLDAPLPSRGVDRERTSGSRVRVSVPVERPVEHLPEPTSDEPVEWTFQHRRPWRKILIAAGVVVALGASAWFTFGRSSAADDTASASGSVASPAAPAGDEDSPSNDGVSAPRSRRPGESAALPAGSGEPGSTATRGETPTGGATTAESHGRTEGPVPPPAATAPRSGAEGAQASAPTHEAATRGKARPADSSAIVQTVLPKINVDRVANRIGQSAREHMDSLGRTITVKPPSFGKPEP